MSFFAELSESDLLPESKRPEITAECLALKNAVDKGRKALGLKLIQLRKTFGKRGDGFIQYVDTVLVIPARRAQRLMEVASGRTTQRSSSATARVAEKSQRVKATRSSNPEIRRQPSAQADPEVEYEHIVNSNKSEAFERRDAKTRTFIEFWSGVFVKAKALGAHLTDCTTSIEAFDDAKRTLHDVAMLIEEELQNASPQQIKKRQRSIFEVLPGGRD